jgi:uncharacterized protein YggE
MKTSLTALLCVVLFALLIKYGAAIPVSVTSTVTNKNETFSVSGEGKITVVPDMARLSVGVETQGATVKQTQGTMNTAVNKVTDALKQLVDTKDIQTSSYSVNPEYDYTGGKPRITGFRASSSLSVKVKDLDKVNDVIDTATKNGATTVGGIQFEVEDQTKAENEARTKAVADAKKKAELAAQTAGFTLGRIINYQESTGGNSPRPIMYAAKAMAEDASGTQVQPGSSDVMMTVTLSYELQ